MRKFLIILSAGFFILSGIVIVKALNLPPAGSSYYDQPQSSQPSSSAGQQEDVLRKLADEQEANRLIVEQMQDTIAKLENELSRKSETEQKTEMPAGAGNKDRLLAVLGAGTFRSGQIEITEEMKDTVMALVPEIAAAEGFTVVIEGHTDSLPIRPDATRRYRDNMDLSYLRAKAVAGILIEKGIGLERISVVGYGDTRPVASNDSVDGRLRNRRVEIRLTSGGGV